MFPGLVRLCVLKFEYIAFVRCERSSILVSSKSNNQSWTFIPAMLISAKCFGSAELVINYVKISMQQFPDTRPLCLRCRYFLV